MCAVCACVDQNSGPRLRIELEQSQPAFVEQPILDCDVLTHDQSLSPDMVAEQSNPKFDGGVVVSREAKFATENDQDGINTVDELDFYRHLVPDPLKQHDVPEAAIRQGLFTSMTRSQQRAIIRLLDRVLACVAKDLVPNDAEQVIMEFRTRKYYNADILKTIVRGINATPRGSIERRTLRACLCATTAAEEVRELLSRTDDVVEAETPVDDDNIGYEGNKDQPSVRDDIQSSDAENGAVVADRNSVANVLPSPHNGSRASGCDFHSKKSPKNMGQVGNPIYDMDRCENVEQCISRNSRTSSKRKRSGSFQRMFSKSRAEWNHILAEGTVPPNTKRSVKRVDDDVLRVVLEFLLSPENLRLTSHGAKRVRHGQKWLYLPAFIRRMPCEQMFRKYVMYVDERFGSNGTTIGRTTFLRIIQMLTRGEQYRNPSIDCYTSVLVRGNINTVRRIIQNEVENEAERIKMLETADAVEEFLIFKHLPHISSEVNSFCKNNSFLTIDCVHNIHYGLFGVSAQEMPVAPVSSCKLCLAPFQFIHDIYSGIRCVRADVTAALDSARHKIFLYLGHHLRCFNQERMLTEAFHYLTTVPPGSAAVLLMDFREKIEVIRFREKVVEMHGRKGMAWHGTVAFVRRASGVDVRRDGESPTEELSTWFMNHVVANDLGQDGLTTGSLLEAVLAQMRNEIPELKEVWILSDNSKRYQNLFSAITAPFIAHKQGLRLLAHTYTEVPQAKAVVDGHFGSALDRVNRFCKEMKLDVTTPTNLSKAIGYRGGVPNSSVELIQVNRNSSIVKRWGDARKAGKLEKVGRADKIVYDGINSDRTRVRLFPYFGSQASTWTFGIWFSQWNGGEQTVEHDLMDLDLGINLDQSGGCEEERYVFTGSVTGVEVTTRTEIRRSSHRGVVRAFAPLEDALAELCCDRGDDGGENNEDLASESHLPQCSLCGRLYLHFSALEIHKKKCRGPMESGIVQERVPGIARGVLNKLDLNTFFSLTSNDVGSINLSPEIRLGVQFRKLWARRLTYNQCLGENTVEQYSEVITNWFDRGHRGRKIGASGMLHQLVLDRPLCYDLPSEHHISQYLYSIANDHGKPAWTSPGGRGRRGMPQKYVLGLEQLLRGTPNLKPRDAMDALILLLNLKKDKLPEDFPSEQAVKNKVSNLKWSMRELAARNRSSNTEPSIQKTHSGTPAMHSTEPNADDPRFISEDRLFGNMPSTKTTGNDSVAVGGNARCITAANIFPFATNQPSASAHVDISRSVLCEGPALPVTTNSQIGSSAILSTKPRSALAFVHGSDMYPDIASGAQDQSINNSVVFHSNGLVNIRPIGPNGSGVVYTDPKQLPDSTKMLTDRPPNS